MIIDFTTPAMVRPEIIDQTYSSFSNRLKGVDLKKCRLIINIDPLPTDVSRKNVVKVAKKYFGEVIYNYPDTANFSAACNWIWSQAETDCIFHLEDDWVLKVDVNMKKLIRHFNENKNLQAIQLRAYRFAYNKIALSPLIMHKKVYKHIAGKLDITLNPEVQMRGERFKGLIMPYPTKKISHKGKIITYPKARNQIILRDIGRKWIKKTEYTKQKVKKARFVTWEKK